MKSTAAACGRAGTTRAHKAATKSSGASQRNGLAAFRCAHTARRTAIWWAVGGGGCYVGEERCRFCVGP